MTPNTRARVCVLLFTKKETNKQTKTAYALKPGNSPLKVFFFFFFGDHLKSHGSTKPSLRQGIALRLMDGWQYCMFIRGQSATSPPNQSATCREAMGEGKGERVTRSSE